jgi:hypothetical protein
MQTQSAHNLILSEVAAGRRIRIDQDDPRLQGTLTLADRLLASGSPPAAIIAGLRDIMLDRLDVTVSTGPGGTAWLLTWLLRHRPGPFTPVIAAVTGCEVRAETIPGSDGEHRLTGAQAVALNVLDLASSAGWGRRAFQVAGTTVASETELILLPSRVGKEALDRIKDGEPCGQVIPGLVRAGRLSRACWPGDPAVLGGATLQVAGRGIGLARERITAELIRRVTG